MTNASEPFWSVMMPVYRPDIHYFRLALEGVLKQDEGPERMQIEVVDDCSPDGDVEKMVREIGGDRVAFSRTPKNLGLAGCWNTCIDRARGKWVHLFHQDDLVLPGFYKAMAQADASSENVGAAFCRHAWCDGEGHWQRISELHAKAPEILRDFSEKILIDPQIQTPTIVVKRSVYEKLGRFRSDLKYTLDWEMWHRIASQYEYWFEPSILALYRQHSGAETSRIRKVGGFAQDYQKLFDGFSSSCMDRRHRKILDKAWERYAKHIAYEARGLLVAGNNLLALEQLFYGLSLRWNFLALCEVPKFFFLWMRLIASKCKANFFKFISDR